MSGSDDLDDPDLQRLAAMGVQILDDRTGLPRPAQARRRSNEPQWEEPIDVVADPGLTGAATLDETCCPARVLGFAQAEAERLAVDPTGIAALSLGVCSSVISDDWKIRLKFNDRSWLEQARLWVALIADPGQKKSEQVKAATRPVRKIEDKLRAEHKQAMARYHEAMADWNARGKKAGEPPPKEPKARRLMTGDFTVESLSDILQGETRKLLCLQDELSGFFGAFERYNSAGGKMNSARGHILSAYEGGPHQIDRVQRGAMFVPNWSLAVVGGVQPAALRREVEDLNRDGLLQRFMLIQPPRAVPSEDDDRPTDWESVDQYRHLIESLSELRPHALHEGFAPVHAADQDREAITEARMRVFRVVNRIEADPTLPAGLRQSASKWRGTLARLALTFHCIEMIDRGWPVTAPLTVETMEMAVRFVLRIVLPATFGFYMGADETGSSASPAQNARWVAGWILAHGAERVTMRDVGRASVGMRGRPDQIMAALRFLVEVAWLEPSRDKRNAWEVNPLVHRRFSAQAEAERAKRRATRDLIRTSVADVVSRELDGL